MTTAIVDNQCLIDIANAIRTQNGTTDTYKPSEMANAISSIQTGIEPSGTLEVTENGTYDVTEYASANVNVENYDDGYQAGLDAMVLKTVISHNNNDVTTIMKGYEFWNCSQLVSVSYPNLTRIGGSVFGHCTSLTSCYIPKVNIIQSGAFLNCSSLQRFELNNISQIHSTVFKNCSSLDTFIIRNNTPICTLGTQSFDGTPIASGAGYIYVPDDLVETYKSATNWSVHASQIKPLSELGE